MRTYVLNLNKCNQRCIFCMVSKENQKPQDITYELVVNEIKLAKRKGFDVIDFYGGEPTVFSFLKKAIKLVNDMGLAASLATNGIKFASESYTASFFSGIDVDSIRVSLHSTGPDIHDRITGCKGSLKKTIRGIKNLLKYNKRLRVNVVITALNYKELSRIVNFLNKIGVSRIKFSGLVWGGDALKNTWLAVNADYIYPYFQEAVDLARKLRFRYIECEKLPRCILGTRHFDRVHYIKEDNIGFAKAKQCYNCKFIKDCDGLSPYDLNTFTPEFLFSQIRRQPN